MTTTPTTSLPEPYNRIQPVNNAQLAELMATQALTVLDVRTPEEWQTLGMIPMAVGIPIQELVARLGELDKTQPIAVICEHGIRSWDSACYLAQQGFTTIYNHSEGMSVWDGPRHFPE